MLNRHDKQIYIYIISDLRGKPFDISPFSVTLTVEFRQMSFIILMYLPETENFLLAFLRMQVAFL